MLRMVMSRGGEHHEKEDMRQMTLPGGPSIGDGEEDMDMRKRRAAYSDGYDDGRRDAEREMRRHARSHWDENPEDRRGSRSHWDKEPEDRRATYAYGGDDVPEARQIGFVSPEERKEMRMMMHDMREMHDSMMKSGKASVKKLAKPLESVLDDAVEIIDNPPSTWKKYLEKGDVAGIVKMEGKELLEALESGKAPHEVRKEFTHTMAALLQMVSK